MATWTQWGGGGGHAEGSSSRIPLLIAALLLYVVICFLTPTSEAKSSPPNFDSSLLNFNNERTCWTGEVCKTEFHSQFRCRCPRWYWCRGPGRYYHAYCSMAATGYVWIQPGGLRPEDLYEQ